MMTITEFLLARIAEDEAHVGRCLADLRVARDDISPSSPYARTLAECAAKRALVKFHQPMPVQDAKYDPNCKGCWEASGMDGAPTYPCPSLRMIAAVYAAHPDYNPEWRV